MANGQKCNNKSCKTIVTEIRRKDGQYKKYCSISCQRIGVADKVKQTSLLRYGVSNPSKSKEIKDKIKNSFTEKYGEGITNAMDLEEFREKIKDTNVERHGTDKPQLLEEFENKSKQTCLEKYGIEKPQRLDSFKQKTKNTNLEKYGVEHSSKLKITQDKKVETNLEKYGVTNVMHFKNTFDRNRYYKKKNYLLPSGKTIKLQGYEDKCLNLLLEKFVEDEICVNPDILPIFYLENNKKHRYYPDIYIPKKNLIIEVKSKYTYDGFIGWYNINLLKRQACIDAGYNFQFMIFDKDGNLLKENIDEQTNK